MFNFQFPYWKTPLINKKISDGGKTILKDEDFILREIHKFKSSKTRFDMLRGIAYYNGDQDILKRKRTCIGEKGDMEEVTNIPNNKIVDNQYKKLVTQKINYLLGKSFTLDSSKEYSIKLRKILNRKFMTALRNVCQDSINCGIGYMYIYYNNEGELDFKVIKPWEVVAGWSDDEHTKLDYAIRFYETLEYEGKKECVKNKVEVFDKIGIRRYEIKNGKLINDGAKWKTPYFYYKDKDLNWDKLPLIPFKYNEETPLLKNVKTLQDGLNLIISNFQNAMEEEPRNTIMILKNYDGENLGEFRKNLATYGAVKVSTFDGVEGGIETLNIEVNCENYKCLIDIFKKAIIENGMGYDAKNDKLGSNPNMMNILSMYSDIDIDSIGMEKEYSTSIENIIWFINTHLANTGQGNYMNENVNIVFNKNILINESELIDNCIKSKDMLSNETIIAKHPWVTDPAREIKRINKEINNERKIDENGNFRKNNTGNNEPNDNRNDKNQNSTSSRN